jgi:hypothetical protein
MTNIDEHGSLHLIIDRRNVGLLAAIKAAGFTASGKQEVMGGENPLDEYFISPANEEKLKQVIALWEASSDIRGRRPR